MGSSVREYKSPATISNMKNILALCGCFLTGSCLPAPGIKLIQQCHGSKCHSRSAFGAGFDSSAADIAIRQRCKGGKCDQDQAFGLDFSDDFDFFGSSSSDFDTWNIQNCEGSHCKQGNDFGRKKRGISQQCHGRQCEQNNAVESGNGDVSGFPVEQKCQDGQCKQNNAVSSSGFGNSWPFGRKKRGISISQQCVGSHCNQRTGFSDGNVDANVGQRCEGGECDQDSAFGVDFGLDWILDWFSSDSGSRGSIQNCKEGSNCNQGNDFVRKKRGISQQ